MGVKGEGERITILHKNIPNMLGQFTTLLAEKDMNIALMTNKSRKEYAYTMIDVDSEVSAELEEADLSCGRSAESTSDPLKLKIRVIR